MISVEDALSRCLDLVTPLPAEPVALRHAVGRWMASPATALRDQPPFAVSAMDGYAVQGDAAPGTTYTVIGKAGAGHAFSGVLLPGSAIRIFTGAPLPTGANRVVIQEDVDVQADEITLKRKADTATHIRSAGQDFRVGDTVSPRLLRPNDLALLASMNVPTLNCTRRPVIAIIATGDELVMPGEQPRHDQIIASNGFTIAALAEQTGATARLLPIARDTIDDLVTVLTLAAGADLVVTIGGASVGDHDLLAEAASRLGFEQAFWRIAMRPGKPLMAGRLSGVPMLGLPGNPVSAIICTHLFVLPMLRAMLGQPDPAPKPCRAILAGDTGPAGPRTHYMRARLHPRVGLPGITPYDRQDSSLLTVLASADALLIRPADDGPVSCGTEVAYLPL